MGSAVSGAANSVISAGTNILSGKGGATDLTNLATGGAGGATSGAGQDIANIVNAVVPEVPIADQSQLQQQIQNSQAQANQNQADSQYLQNKANLQYGSVQQAIGQSQGAINNAQQTNQGGNVANSLALLQAQANGTAPSAAQAQLQSGKDQAIATQHALANSGNLSQQISGQKTAMDNAASLTQQAANQATQLQATQQQVGQQTYANAAAQQASTANANAQTQQQQAAQQASLYNSQLGAATNYAGQANTANSNAISGQTNALGIQQQALGQTAQNRAQALGGMLNAGGGALALSDENSKKNIQDDQSNKYDFTYSKIGSEKSQKIAKSIKDSFLSDEDTKKDIKKGSKVEAFLDAIDPVSFEYKDSDGQMGRTPGEHLGVIAQQVEKAPGGASMIVETPEGKGIDLASAVGTLLAAAAQNHNRLEDLEDLFKSKKSAKDKK